MEDDDDLSSVSCMSDLSDKSKNDLLNVPENENETTPNFIFDRQNFE